MRRTGIYLFVAFFATTSALNLLQYEYLDPTKLQTKTSAEVQKDAAITIIRKYSSKVTVEVDRALFSDSKDVFILRAANDSLHIRGSTGVAVVWGFHYYMKEYCNSHIGWQQSRVRLPNPLPEASERVVANDRLRYYQNVCTGSYSTVWWTVGQWLSHVDWMALNGINMALAPVAQEAAWARIYRRLGLTDDEIDAHFTGPAFLAWLRMGNVHTWAGPLPDSWHRRQTEIQDAVLDYMFRLGIVPVLPAFNGHVPKAFSRIFPNTTFYDVGHWSNFGEDYCCGLFLDPNEVMFKDIGKMFLNEISSDNKTGHIYTADPFNEVEVAPWSTALVTGAATAIFATLSEWDARAVWLLQSWMLVSDPGLWPLRRVQALVTAVPRGRLLILDLQSEQWPQYQLYDMYYGQPFIWSMLHNFGGTLGMFGNTHTINKDVYEARAMANSTMIGVGLTPEGINQNYVVYDLMLESAWRKQPVDLEAWFEQYGRRRHGCNGTAGAWRFLLRSVYSFDGLNKMRGKYVITKRPSFKIRPWAWYKSKDLFEAWRRLVYPSSDACGWSTYEHDLVDVTRQALQYRAEQIYLKLLIDRSSNYFVFNVTINQFLDVMYDIQSILSTHEDFSAKAWLSNATGVAGGPDEIYFYQLNARNQITLWGPDGEISDYACKQWAELFEYYYIPRWSMFLSAALDAKTRGEVFDERGAQAAVRATVEQQFASVDIQYAPAAGGTWTVARELYEKWAHIPDLADLPNRIIKHDVQKTTLADVDSESDERNETKDKSVVMLSTTKSMQFVH